MTIIRYDDIFADLLGQNSIDQFVLLGKALAKKTVVNPGQYIAVANVEVSYAQDVWVYEDFADCVGEGRLGEVNPYSVPGGVQVVLIDPNGNVHDIDDDLAAGIGGSIALTPDDVLDITDSSVKLDISSDELNSQTDDQTE